MKSNNMAHHFHTLQEQRTHYLPCIQSLSQEQLWYREKEGKWSIGEHFYHLYHPQNVENSNKIFTTTYPLRENAKKQAIRH